MMCKGVRQERGSLRQPGVSGGKKVSYKHGKKQGGNMKTSRSSPGQLGAAVVEDDRDPESYQTVSIQVGLV